MNYSQKEKRILRGIVVKDRTDHRGWRVKMTGGILWFALAEEVGAQFSIGDKVKAIDHVDDANRLRISHISQPRHA